MNSYDIQPFYAVLCIYVCDSSSRGVNWMVGFINVVVVHSEAITLVDYYITLAINPKTQYVVTYAYY